MVIQFAVCIQGPDRAQRQKKLSKLTGTYYSSIHTRMYASSHTYIIMSSSIDQSIGKHNNNNRYIYTRYNLVRSLCTSSSIIMLRPGGGWGGRGVGIGTFFSVTFSLALSLFSLTVRSATERDTHPPRTPPPRSYIILLCRRLAALLFL